MKINNIEPEIINMYVVKNKQERIIYEFSNPKKRENVIWRFAGSDIFKSSCLQLISYMSPKEMEKYLFNLSGNREAYIIGENYIGKLYLKEAVEQVYIGGICIIYCGNGIGYYQGEQEYGKPPRYLLIQS